MTKTNTVKHVIQHDDLAIAYRDSGLNATFEPRPTILFLGGLCSNMNGTKALLLDQYCAQNGLRFVRFDYRGHGESGGEFTQFGIDDWVDDAILILDKIINGQVILIGSSMGGWIAAALAKRRAGLIKAFIGIASAPDFTQKMFWPQLSNGQRAEIANHHIVELESGYDEPYKIGKALMDGGNRALVMNEKLEMDFPVRLFHGMGDQSVSLNTAIELANHIFASDLRLTLVKDADHGFSRAEDMELIYHEIRKLSK